MADEFSPAERARIEQRSKGRCECTMEICSSVHRDHEPACCKRSAQEIHHRDRTKPATASNGVHMCGICHKRTATYGKPK